MIDERGDKIRYELIREIQTRLEKADPEELKALRERLWNMIQYAVGRHDYYENYRTRYLTIATALLTVSVAGLAFMVQAKINGLPAIFFFSAFLILGITGCFLIERFRAETSPDYPYRKVAKVTSWYHFYTLPSENKDLLFSLKNSESREQMKENYKKELKTFTSKWINLNESERIQEDLEQVWILYTLQAYKRVFIKRMANFLGMGIFAFIILIIAAGFSYIIPSFGKHIFITLIISASIGLIACLICNRYEKLKRKAIH